MDKIRTHKWESHGTSSDINEGTPMNKVKGPNVFQRAKEEIEAIVAAINSKKSSDHQQHSKKDEKEMISSILPEKADEQTEESVHSEKSHHKETHDASNDIDEGTPIDKVKGPNVFQRAKEEIEAIAGTIHPKKEYNNEPRREKDGFWEFLAKSFEKFCSPFSGKRD